MKRLASLLLVVVLVATMVPASLLSALALDVSVISPVLPDGYVAVYTGGGEADKFAVDFNLELADGLEVIAGYEVEISWDSSVLAYDGLATFGPGIVGVEEGESSVVLAVANASNVLSGHLFTVDFCTLAAGDTTVTVKVLSMATASGLIEAEGGSLDISIVDGRPTNLAAGLDWTSDTKPGGGYEGDITDGKIEPDGVYDKTLWHGFDKRNTDDNVVTVTIDLGAIYTNIHEVRAHVWPAGYSGIAVPAAYVFYASTDGETYTELANVAGVASDPTWVGTDLEDTIKARYIKFEIIGSEATTFWFVSELEVNAFDPEIYEEPVEVIEGEGNLAAGLTWTGDTDCGTAYKGDITDGKIDTEGHYDQTIWYGFDSRLTGDNAATIILDLGALYSNIAEVRAFVWPAGYSGIVVPSAYIFYASTDGETYTELANIAGEASDPTWVGTALEEVITARYIKLEIIGSDQEPFWFIGELEVNAKAKEEPPVEPDPVPNTKVEVNVNDNAILTDGKTGFTGNWGEVGTGDVLLVTNDNCREAGMDVTLLYALGEAKKIDSVTIDLYHCAGVMIGYPEGQATVLVSTDGETYTEVGAFDLAAADVAVGSYGTVSSTFEFDAVEAAYVKVLLYAGSNEAVLGDSPADGKIFWEFISVAEFAVGEYVPPVAEKHSITISHVNAYNWECYYEMVVVGEGKVATDIYNGNYTNWIAFKVENIDEIYTVTAIEGKGVAKTLVAPADGFLVYCASNDAASFAAAGLVEVGDVLLSCDFDWRKNGASATPMGTMVFGPQPSKDHDHEYTSKVTKEPTLAAEGEMLYVCVCGERYTDAIPAVKAQPDELVELPEGAYTLDYAGYKHAAEFSIVVGSGMTVAELTALGNNGTAKDMNYAYIVVVDANGKVVKTWFELAVSKAEVVCPAGGYIISYNGNKEGYDVLADIEEGCTISLYNVDLDAIDGVAGNVELTDAGFTVVRPEADVVIDVNENELLTDGNTGYTEGWDSTSGKVVLAQNPYCTTVGMNVTLLYALEETKKIESVTVDFYFDKNVMIGYPEGTATVLVSTDGETYTKVGTFDLAEADLSAPGTVSNLFKFEGVDAAFVKVELFVGSNEDVLGDSPADGKIFWEFISVAEFAVAEAPVNLAEGKGWTGDTNIGSSYVGDITDGKIDPNRWGAYDTTVWYGFDQRNSGDSIGTMIIDLGAVYTNLAYIRAYVWPAGASGIAVPKSYDFYISEDGETYTLVTSVVGEKNDPVWVYTDNTDVLTARYIKLDIVGSSSDTFWFIGEIEVNSYDPQIVDDDPIDPPVDPDPVPNTEVEVNVNDNAILTDGETGFTGNWGEVGTGDVLLITNGNCTAAGMDVTLLYALGEAKKIDSVTIDLYHCAGVMIGYPEGQATVLVSTDGETYTEIGKFDLTAAEVASGAYGTVSSTFEFDAVEAAYVKVLLYAGSNEAVLGDSPADGKIFWEFISVAEFAVGEVEEAPTYEFGDVNGDGKVNTADYVVLKRHIMNTYELNEDQLTRANINGDAKINTADYVLLKRFIMGSWKPN